MEAEKIAKDMTKEHKFVSYGIEPLTDDEYLQYVDKFINPD